MILAANYLIRRFFYRIKEFLRHWYAESSRIYLNFFLKRLRGLDRYFAWEITLRNLFQPLYKDRSLIGYILGFIFRALRFFIATIVYGIVFAVAVFFFLLWLALPPLLVYKIFLNDGLF